ncbi:MAG: HAD-IIA family hydrolase [Clostridia bacterium]|nr:HAD-IIA family hydrolase [Clostridia bacterium]
MKDFFGKDMAALKNKKLFLFDMDGTIYLGNTLFDGVLELLDEIEKRGGRYVFITNNSSKSVADYVKKLNRLGIEKVTEENFFTSAQATAMLMKEKFPTGILYVQGTRSFVEELKGAGLNVTTEYAEDAAAIVVGYDTELNYEKMMTTCKMLKFDLPYYAANPDWVCPYEFGAAPDCGWMCRGYEMAMGKTPEFIGKPQPTMINVVRGKFGVEKEEVLVIGDRLYTDIASGNNAGVDTLCVLSGEVSAEEVIETIQGEKEAEKPVYTAMDVTALLATLKE